MLESMALFLYFFLYFYYVHYYRCPHFPPAPLSQPPLNPYPPPFSVASTSCCLCLWVVHVCSLANSFASFHLVLHPISPLTTICLFLGSTPVSLLFLSLFLKAFYPVSCFQILIVFLLKSIINENLFGIFCQYNANTANSHLESLRAARIK